jgi:flagellar protein FlaG
MDTVSITARQDVSATTALSSAAVAAPAATPKAAASANATDTTATAGVNATTVDKSKTGQTASKAEVKKSVDAINRFLEPNSEVHFSIDEASGRSVVKVVDNETKKVIQQFPSEQSLEIGKNLTSLKGLLINNTA